MPSRRWWGRTCHTPRICCGGEFWSLGMRSLCASLSCQPPSEHPPIRSATPRSVSPPSTRSLPYLRSASAPANSPTSRPLATKGRGSATSRVPVAAR
eukprot:scaffold22859_cov96-Isochrysis_galbana.AAC.1